MRTTLNYDLFRIHHFLVFLYLVFAVVGVFIVRSEGLAAWLMVLLFLLLAAVHWYAATRAKRGDETGRAVSTVIGCLLLLGFPIGTAVGIFILLQVGKKWESADVVVE